MIQTLDELLAPFLDIPGQKVLFSGIQLDSRLVKPGDVFFALLGTHRDGRRYVEDAIARGAVAVVAEPSAPLDLGIRAVPIVYLSDLNKKLSAIAGRFFEHPSRKLTVLGTSGTNGKTTATHIFAQAYEHLGIKLGTIGTLGVYRNGVWEDLGLTTPDAVRLQQELHRFVETGHKGVAMEVSSHALHQGRVEDILFSSAIFTNLTQDHLDYHGTMERYGEAKRRLFKQPGLKYAVLNADDPFSKTIVTDLDVTVDAMCYSTKHQIPISGTRDVVYAENVTLLDTGLRCDVVTPYGRGHLVSKLVGLFNVSNLLAVLTTMLLEGIPFDDALESLHGILPVPGRMQRHGGGVFPVIVVDYAHTPDALKQVLLALKAHCKRHLWVVVGCGGDRDRSKRPLMGQVASSYADRVVLTSDNPRHEQPEQIIQDMLAGSEDVSRVVVEPDRLEAIRYALLHALPDDVILVAGRGHEAFQQIGEDRIPFADNEVVSRLLSEAAHEIN